MKKTGKKHKKINKESIIFLIERIIEHKAFRPISLAILISYLLFSLVLRINSYVLDYKERQKIEKNQAPINIQITQNGKIIDFDEIQIEERRVKSSDSVVEFLSDIEVENNDINAILQSIKKVYDMRLMKVGNSLIAKYKVKISYDKDSKSLENPKRKVVLDEFRIIISPELEYAVSRLENGEYQAKEIKQVVVKKMAKYRGVIKNGLFLDAINAGASPNAVMNMINLYSYDVDFQRDLKEGDEFEILSESYFTENGRKVRDGTILFSLLKLNGREIAIYGHKTANGFEYFDAKGNSVRKSLLRTPVNGARISSGFGFRKHPVLGYSKLHKGVDFAAPSGTPILAAGSGVIVKMERFGGYGNYVRIKHNAEYETAYAHASRFSNKFKRGAKVKQGDVIAYVGSTGRSTGPHLHFEIMYKGSAINPAKVKTVSGIRLAGAELSRFLANKAEIDKYRKNIK